MGAGTAVAMNETKPPIDMYPFYDELRVPKPGVTRIAYQFIRPMRRLIPIPLHTFLPLLFELYLALLRLLTIATPVRFRGRRDLLINLAAGSNGRHGWVNVDIFPWSGINCLYDCRRRLPFADNSARGIFCEHFLEHLDYTEEVPAFLSECRRVLRPGGVLRLVVPDAGRYLQAYGEPGWQSLARMRPLDDGHRDAAFRVRYRTKMELVNMVFRQGPHHRYAYDYDTLEFLLCRYGFSHVHRQEFARSLMEELSIDWAQRSTESLYVEAVK